MMPDLDIYQEDRPWGNFRRFIQNSPCTVKIITVKAGEGLSLQSHKGRAEFWRILSGTGKVQIHDTTYISKPGEEYHIPVGAKHRMIADTDTQFLEICTGDFSEDDLTRYEDKYGRV